MVTSFYSNYWGQTLLVLALLYGNCPLIFKTLFILKLSVLFSKLSCRCFITFFQVYLTVT